MTAIPHYNHVENYSRRGKGVCVRELLHTPEHQLFVNLLWSGFRCLGRTLRDSVFSLTYVFTLLHICTWEMMVWQATRKC